MPRLANGPTMDAKNTRAVRAKFPVSTLTATLLALSVAPAARAFPGFMASKGKPPVVHSTHIVVMKKGPSTVVTLMPDYQGSLEPFVIVLPVPADVTADHVVTLKREYVDHADQISAPRFHEFWEQDPCDPGPPEQEWQRDLRVTGSGFLGAPAPGGGEHKVAKELLIDTQVRTKEGEYTMSVLPAGTSPLGWLKEHGYRAPPGTDAAIAPYVSAGNAFVAAEVDVKRIELVGGDRAQLSPIRFFTQEPYDTLPVKLGIVNAPANDLQEIVVYTLDPDKRYEVQNYKTITPPTNIEVDFDVKERMGEFYNSLYDRILAKNPDTVLLEYAWSFEGCGQPCATVPFELSELLSLGGDVFERAVSEEELNPKPPALTAEEKELDKELLKPLKPKERRKKQKELQEDREKVARIKALVERNKYVLTRLHFRFGKATLPRDPKLAPANALEGGIALPKGQKREANMAVVAAKESKLQTRYNNFHNWKPVIHCPSPDRWRWGKSPPDYRGLRKTWIADDLTRKSRTQINAQKMILTPLPELGLGPGFEPKDAGADAADAGEAPSSKKTCGCRVPGGGRVAGAPLFLVLGAALGLGRSIRRRARRR